MRRGQVHTNDMRTGLYLVKQTPGGRLRPFCGRVPRILVARFVQLSLGLAQLAIDCLQLVAVIQSEEVPVVAGDAACEIDNSWRQGATSLRGPQRRCASE